MTSEYIDEFPDPVYGSADANVLNNKRLRVSSSGELLHAFAGGVYLAMSERNWQKLFSSLGRLEIEVPPKVTHRLVVNNDEGTAHFVTEVKS